MSIEQEIPQTGFVTTSWVKKRYAISNSTFYQWVADKRLFTVKIGPRAVRVSVEHLRAFEATFKSPDVKPR